MVVTFSIIYILDYTGGLVSGRHFLNLELISLLIISYYFFNDMYEFRKRNMSIAAIGLLLVVVGILTSLRNYKRDTDSIIDSTNCYEATMQTIENIYSDRIIVLTTNNFHLFDHIFSLKNKKYTNNIYLMYDFWTYGLTPPYLNYLQRTSKCDPLDPVAFFKWLSNNRALYIAELKTYDLTSQYMNIVHGQKVKFTSVDGFKKSDCIANTDMWMFELRKISVEN